MAFTALPEEEQKVQRSGQKSSKRTLKAPDAARQAER
jgi:hypothetical protein